MVRLDLILLCLFILFGLRVFFNQNLGGAPSKDWSQRFNNNKTPTNNYQTTNEAIKRQCMIQKKNGALPARM